MNILQLIGYSLLNTSAITALTTHIKHGSLLEEAKYPAINFYGVPTYKNGLGNGVFTLNHRAYDEETALQMAKETQKLFTGSSFTSVYGVMNGFNVQSISQSGDVLLNYEESGKIWNAIVNLRFVFFSSEET